jgi:hypothetical protein
LQLPNCFPFWKACLLLILRKKIKFKFCAPVLGEINNTFQSKERSGLKALFFTMALRMEEVSIETMEEANSIGY